MKTTISLFLITFFIQMSAFAQTIDKLDENYGFEIFKFGTSPDNYSGKLKEDTSNLYKHQGVSGYSYTGKEMEYLYNVKTKEVDLTFYNKQLMCIQVEFPETFSLVDYNVILTNLQKLYGNGFDFATSGRDISQSVGRIWVGKKVDMEIHRLYYTKTSEWNAYIILQEKAIAQKRKTDEF